MRRIVLVLLVAVAANHKAAVAQVAPHYSLWHPVPRADLGALSSDRPGNGENPFILAAGHYQFEIGALGFTRVGSHLPGAAAIGAGQIKLRTGVVSGFEGQLIFDGYKWQRGGTGQDWSGASGGVTARGKLNFWGNDGGSTAFALIPSAGLGRDGEGRWLPNGGLVATLGAHGPWGWSVGLTAAALVAGQHESPAVAGGSAVLGLAHTLAGSVSVMFEGTLVRAKLSDRSTEARVGGGFMAALGSSLQLDAGVDLGLSAGAESVRSYFGIVRRF